MQDGAAQGMAEGGAGCRPRTCGVGAQADRPSGGPAVSRPGFGMGSGGEPLI